MIAWVLMGMGIAAEPDTVLAQSAVAHGLTRDRRMDVSFTFRGTPYRLHLDGSDIRYERTVKGPQGERVDRLVGSVFSSLHNGAPMTVAPENEGAWRRSLNSVAYFATLPRPLFDDAVIATFLGRTTFAGAEWDTVEVRFQEEGGGDDHDDVFRYWFHPETHEMGFVAYVFHVGKGGVRIRKAARRHEVNGVVLLDWTNLGWDGTHTLESAMAAYERGGLPTLSTIALENIEVTPLDASAKD
ncbi:MAG: DUF6503 family protein [Myxococcota bacterium]